MRDWVAVLGHDLTDEDPVESESGSDDQPKGTLRRLLQTSQLNTILETLEKERAQLLAI